MHRATFLHIYIYVYIGVYLHIYVGIYMYMGIDEIHYNINIWNLQDYEP